MLSGKTSFMSDLKSTVPCARTLPVLHTQRLTLVLASPEHAQVSVDFFKRNRAHLAPWDPPTPIDFYTQVYWEKLGNGSQVDFLAGVGVRLNVFLPQKFQTLVGRINFSQISRGAFQSCMLGYALDAEHQGKGFMHEGLNAAIDYMFTVQKLHRIQANYLPENRRSAAVLKRLGFAIEGLGMQYLFINGQWRDHVLSALLNSQFPPHTSPLS